MALVIANRTDSGMIPRLVASHLGLYALLMSYSDLMLYLFMEDS